ncbi:GDP-mannose mannosyl hydrolase [Stutzerimonas stutzeri]|jgi:colanic acid biosynthesis protein WcaH|uniref:GDP-mannose mannosyl hydrolase n=1 Tax=Stutzerimonas stutzeri TaxID=316 RepID=UPI0024498BDF|nr:GDP-mannose mannosyl hydrolase [Stutzerimonas stutzeri]MDH0427961.1 GDP-mannose mannosyl hydrolase [Stutzerimonas stutzeri]
MWLTPKAFRTVIDATPLVSIDLVVRNLAGEVLLGERLNRPAQGYWFVPGGRILKNESLDDAFRRLTLAELGNLYERQTAQLLGVYEHFYRDSVFAGAGTGPDTHYVVLGYELALGAQSLTLPREQHGRYRWWKPDEMRASEQVHANTRAYLAALR